MGDQIQSNTRIAKNVMYMYIRMIVMLILGFFTARVVFNTLGASDYGLYNVVGGIIVVLASINGTLTSGTQRFLTYTLGEEDDNKQKKVFSTALVLHLLLALIIFILGETIGLWFLIEKLNVPEGRETAAFWVYQFSILSTMVSVVQIPYSASLIAHERMNIYAYMSIYDVVAKLLIIYLIQVTTGDKLIFYGGLVLVIHMTSILINNIYCRYHFHECRQRPRLDKTVFKEMIGFTGWNIIGTMAVPLQNQGLNILLNIFFSTIVNAARGVAVRVNSLVMQFVQNYQVAVNPQIVKLYASGNTREMTSLVLNNSKFAGFLMLIIAVPVFVEMEFVLNIWLGDYPQYTVEFSRIILIQSLIQTLTRPTITALHAVGKIKGANLTGGTILLLIVPISYLLLKLGIGPVIVFTVNLLPWVFETLIVLLFLKRYIKFPVGEFYKKVYASVFPISLILIAIPFMFHYFLPFQGWLRFFIVSIISVISSCIVIFYLGLNKELRRTVVNKIKVVTKSRLPFLFADK